MKRKFLGAVVMLIATALFFSTVVTSDTIEKTDDEQINTAFIKNPNPNPSNIKNTIIEPGAVIFSQLPFDPEEEWIFYTSDFDAGYLTMDNYEVDVDVCDIHWWGLSLVYPWAPCDPTGMVFEIIFWDQSGAPVCVYQVSPPAIPTGLLYSGFEMYYWKVDIDPCCPLQSGWVSIQSIQSPNGCWFLWAGSDDGDLFCYQNDVIQDTDCAFELTDGGADPIPAICCDPVGLDFGTVIPGKTVYGQIYVCNCGEPGSLLDWYLDTTNVPAWGTWNFIPDSGTRLAEGACDIVDVICNLPTTPGAYTGQIYVYNAEDPTDFCECTTQVEVKKSKDISFNILEYFAQHFPLVYKLFGF